LLFGFKSCEVFFTNFEDNAMAVVAIVGLSNVDFDDRTRIEKQVGSSISIVELTRPLLALIPYRSAAGS
jgi:hypothetical protein